MNEEEMDQAKIQERRLISTRIKMSEPFLFTEKVRKPMKVFMNIVGLHEGHSGRALNWYRRVVITFLFMASVRRGTQITVHPPGSRHTSFGDALLDPNVVVGIVIFLFTFSGFLTAIMMERFYSNRKRFFETIDFAMEMDSTRKECPKVKRTTQLLIIVIMVLSCIGGFMDTIWKLGYLTKDLPYTPPLVTKSPFFRPLEAYLTFITQCAISTMACDFFLSCTFLRYVITNVCLQMNKNFRDSPSLVKLQHLEEIQTHHYFLVSAKKRFEDCYSFTVFCFYSFSIPCTCFLSYVAYKNAGTNPGIIFAMGMWISVIIINLLIFSSPAFQLSEEGEQIASSAFDLYQNCLKGENDPRILPQMLILVSQIQSNRISISAYNYFPINRGILLTMFSAIFTYFLILVQFGDDQEPKNATTKLLKAIELWKNVSIVE